MVHSQWMLFLQKSEDRVAGLEQHCILLLCSSVTAVPVTLYTNLQIGVVRVLSCNLDIMFSPQIIPPPHHSVQPSMPPSPSLFSIIHKPYTQRLLSHWLVSGLDDSEKRKWKMAPGNCMDCHSTKRRQH